MAYSIHLRKKLLEVLSNDDVHCFKCGVMMQWFESTMCKGFNINPDNVPFLYRTYMNPMVKSRFICPGCERIYGITLSMHATFEEEGEVFGDVL